jgi:hypothetical protein
MPFSAQVLLPPGKTPQGTLTEGEDSVRLTSLFQLVKISSFLYLKHYLPFFKQAALSEEVNGTEPSLSVSVPRTPLGVNND